MATAKLRTRVAGTSEDGQISSEDLNFKKSFNVLYDTEMGICLSYVYVGMLDREESLTHDERIRER